MVLMGNTYAADQRLTGVLKTIVLKTARREPFLDTKMAIEQARRHQKAPIPFVVCSLGPLIV